MSKARNNKDIDELRSAFVSLSDEMMKVVDPQIEEAVYIKSLLNEIKKDISKYGTTEVFTQGSNTYVRETPSVKVYNSLVKNYTQIMKQIMAAVPDEQKSRTKPGEKLLEFLNQNKQ